MSVASKPFRIAFLGDTHLGSQPVALDCALTALLQGCAHVVVNLESPICKPSPIDSLKILLRSEPGIESVLSDWHVSCATLANNHIFDHGVEGFHATCRALQTQQIVFGGAGDNLDQASRPLILDCDGTRVGIIPCSEPVTQAQIATPDTAGCNHLHVLEIGCQVRNLKAKVDFLIVAPHWGFCDYAYPPATVVSIGEQLLKAGADMIIGHHSHVVQGIRQEDDGKQVVYSLGNFYFDTYKSHGRVVEPSNENQKGLVIIAEFTDGMYPKIWPVFIRHSDRVVSLDASAEREKQWQRRSAPLQSLKTYPAHWRKAVRKRLLWRVFHWLSPRNWRHIGLATIQAGLSMVLQSMSCRLRENNMRHRQ